MIFPNSRDRPEAIGCKPRTCSRSSWEAVIKAHVQRVGGTEQRMYSHALRFRSCAALYLADDRSCQIVNSSKLRYNHPIPSVLLPESFRPQPTLAGGHGALLLRRPIERVSPEYRPVAVHTGDPVPERFTSSVDGDPSLSCYLHPN